MSHASPCPDLALLERSRAGAVTEPERKAVERHLDLCDACNGKLEAMAYDEEGSPRPIACPERSVLRRLADGSLGMYSCEAVENHVEVCAACQEDFDAYASGFEPPPRTAACPDRSTLKRLLDGRLDGHAHAEVESHLESCATACQAGTRSPGLRRRAPGAAGEGPGAKPEHRVSGPEAGDRHPQGRVRPGDRRVLAGGRRRRSSASWIRPTRPASWASSARTGSARCWGRGGWGSS